MGKLRLKSPIVREPQSGDGEFVLVDVAVDAPVPHLEGIYTYRAQSGSVSVGSVVNVPFGNGESQGFVISIERDIGNDPRIKPVTRILESRGLFDEIALERYRKIATLYGSSLHDVIALATSSWKAKNRSATRDLDTASALQPSPADHEFVNRIFGHDWESHTKEHLLLPPGLLWERVAVSIFLAEPVRTLILVPTERHLARLRTALLDREIDTFASLSSAMPKSERAWQFQRILDRTPSLLIGTRGATLAPFQAERVIIVDPGDENFLERHSPYFRADSSEIWDCQVLTLSHSRDLHALAAGEAFIRGKGSGRFNFATTSTETLIKDLSMMIKSGESVAVLVSYNDKSFGNGIICSACRNRPSCECGFPLQITSRNGPASCKKCLQKFPDFHCRFCGGRRLTATRAGGLALATSLGKSIKRSRVIVSTSENPKDDVLMGLGVTVVVATHGLEPRVVTEEGHHRGYDIIVILGGRVAFSSASLARSDRFRLACGRLLGLINPTSGSFLVDIDPIHPEYHEIQGVANGRGVERVLRERKELNLPPYSVLIEMSGEDRVLHRLRSALLTDPLFQRGKNAIFPAHDGSMMIKIDVNDREECIRLLVQMSRVRSAKRLPRVIFRVEPEDY